MPTKTYFNHISCVKFCWSGHDLGHCGHVSWQRVGIGFVLDGMIAWVYIKFWRFRQDVKYIQKTMNCLFCVWDVDSILKKQSCWVCAVQLKLSKVVVFELNVYNVFINHPPRSSSMMLVLSDYLNPSHNNLFPKKHRNLQPEKIPAFQVFRSWWWFHRL